MVTLLLQVQAAEMREDLLTAAENPRVAVNNFASLRVLLP